MAKFIANTIVANGFTPVAFSVGDEVPEWASSLVGAHVVDEIPVKGETPEGEQEEAEKASEPESPVEENEPVKAEQPDFTAKSAPKTTRKR